MPKFRVKEEFIIQGWTYIKAENEEKAQRMLENGNQDSFKEIDYTHKFTDWNTFEEVND